LRPQPRLEFVFFAWCGRIRGRWSPRSPTPPSVAPAISASTAPAHPVQRRRPAQPTGPPGRHPACGTGDRWACAGTTRLPNPAPQTPAGPGGPSRGWCRAHTRCRRPSSPDPPRFHPPSAESSPASTWTPHGVPWQASAPIDGARFPSGGLCNGAWLWSPSKKQSRYDKPIHSLCQFNAVGALALIIGSLLSVINR